MKLQRPLLLSALAAAFAAAAFAQTDIPDAPTATAAAMTHPNGPTVVFETSLGRITCQFYQRQAPLTVANFIALAEGTKDWTDPATGKKQHAKPLYDGTVFHRVIPGFMIQGGDPTGTGMGDPGYKFADEFDPNLGFDQPGKLAMANSGPNTNGSQFFITDAPTPWLNGHHTIFGQCDDAGILVERAIANTPRDGSDKPLTPVVLKKVTIVREGQPMPPAPGVTPAQSELPKRITVSSGVAARWLDESVAPDYPIEAKKARVTGTVVVSATIGADGVVKDLQVVSGPQMLQQAALDAVKNWRYRPYLLNGQPVEFHTTVNVIFTLGQ
jgi:peptidyl-prolyl cis-trans isomerase A (cyclophilin A)